jgi:hypothetical protein
MENKINEIQIGFLAELTQIRDSFIQDNFATGLARLDNLIEEVRNDING